MKSALFVVLIVATAGAFWFVWMNRASEKIINSTLPIAVAAILAVILAGWVFADEPDFDAVFPVNYMVDLETKLPLEAVDTINKFRINDSSVFSSRRFVLGPSPITLLKSQRPDLLDANKNNFVRNLYHHLLQRSIIDLLIQIYRGSWKAEPLYFKMGSFAVGRYGGNPKDGEQLEQTILTEREIEAVLRGNWFAQTHVWPPRLCLPPKTHLTVAVPPGDTDAQTKGEIEISNRFCTIRISTEIVSSIRTIGEYRIIAGLSDEEAYHLASNTYLLRAKVSYTKWLAGNPDMKALKQWAEQLVTQVKNNFDEELIWQQVKDDELRSYIRATAAANTMMKQSLPQVRSSDKPSTSR